MGIAGPVQAAESETETEALTDYETFAAETASQAAEPSEDEIKSTGWSHGTRSHGRTRLEHSSVVHERMVVTTERKLLRLGACVRVV